MRINYGASAKTAAGKFGVKGDMLRFQAEDLGDGHLIHRLKLRRNPRLSAIAIEANRRIQRLHRRVGQIRKFILGHNPSSSGDAIHRLVITTSDGHVAGSTGQLFVLRP